MELEEVTHRETVRKHMKEGLVWIVSALEVWRLLREQRRLKGKTGQKGRWKICCRMSLTKRESISREVSTLWISSESLSSQGKATIHLFG